MSTIAFATQSMTEPPLRRRPGLGAQVPVAEHDFARAASMSEASAGTALTRAVRPGVRTRLTRRGRVVLAILVVVPLIVGGTVLAHGGGAFAGAPGWAPASFTHVTVEPGESLWNIATSIAPHADPRDVVRAIAELNGLPSSIVDPGQVLAIPTQYAR